MRVPLLFGIASLIPGLGLFLQRQHSQAWGTLGVLAGLFVVGLQVPAWLSDSCIAPLISTVWIAQLYYAVSTAHNRAPVQPQREEFRTAARYVHQMVTEYAARADSEECYCRLAEHPHDDPPG